MSKHHSQRSMTAYAVAVITRHKRTYQIMGNKSIDIALIRYVMVSEEERTSFTQPLDIETKQYVTTVSAIHFPLVTTHQFNWLGLLRPYHFWTWMTLLFAALSCATFLTVIEHRRRRKATTKQRPSAARHLELLMRIFFEQDIPNWLSKRNKAATALLFGWGLFCAIFCNVYKSELLTAMTVDLRVNNTPFRDFVTMKAAGFKLAGVRGYDEPLIDILRRETNGTADGDALRTVLMSHDKWPNTPAEAIRLQGNRTEKIVLFSSSENLICTERSVNIAYEARRNHGRPTRLPSLKDVYKVPKEVGNRTKISKAIDKQLSRLQETGVWLGSERKAKLATRLASKRAFESSEDCKNAKQLNQQYQALRDKTPINLMQLVSPFLLLAVGIFSGILAYAVEDRLQF